MELKNSISKLKNELQCGESIVDKKKERINELEERNTEIISGLRREKTKILKREETL